MMWYNRLPFRIRMKVVKYTADVAHVKRVVAAKIREWLKKYKED